MAFTVLTKSKFFFLIFLLSRTKLDYIDPAIRSGDDLSVSFKLLSKCNSVISCQYSRAFVCDKCLLNVLREYRIFRTKAIVDKLLHFLILTVQTCWHRHVKLMYNYRTSFRYSRLRFQILSSVVLAGFSIPAYIVIPRFTTPMSFNPLERHFLNIINA